MPYITKQDQARYDVVLGELQKAVDNSGISNGDLNYLMTKLGLQYLKQHGTSYNTISDVVKALECAKLEFYRRVAANYEDGKKLQNGDIF